MPPTNQVCNHPQHQHDKYGKQEDHDSDLSRINRVGKAHRLRNFTMINCGINDHLWNWGSLFHTTFTYCSYPAT